MGAPGSQVSALDSPEDEERRASRWLLAATALTVAVGLAWAATCELDEITLAYVGDGNNVARSLAMMGTELGIDVVVSSPAGYELEEGAGGRRVSDPRQAVVGADAVYTDVWVSMGDEASADTRREQLAGWRVDEELLSEASPDAVVMHCLPAHPGEEISEGLLYGDRQRIWDQAENRRHAQKALLEWLLGRP